MSWESTKANMGSPAPAGIDLSSVAWARIALRFPRTRGDRPVACPFQCANHEVPPHPRG